MLSTPSIAIVDPEMTVTCPPLNTISSAMDAFAHAAEAITAKDVDPFSDTLALEAIRLIMENLDAAYQDGKNIDARAKLSMASTLAGGAFSQLKRIPQGSLLNPSGRAAQADNIPPVLFF